ncbi:hypothetical protein PGIGA_G00048720 [Pangasianodon gigas]|uniref:Uncharacterized protein n=1 Tax=Pangasianodon gigas TaxID=30993 RepID=A0ACC5X211_PANGG|nr:hypothetical protein [Pangasianodon gigas]
MLEVLDRALATIEIGRGEQLEYPKVVPTHRPVPPYHRDRRPPHRPVYGTPKDEPMPTEPDPAAPTIKAAKPRLAGCALHTAPPPCTPTIQVKINGRPTSTLLDTGSTFTLARPSRQPKSQPEEGTLMTRLARVLHCIDHMQAVHEKRRKARRPRVRQDHMAQRHGDTRATSVRPAPAPLIPLPIIGVPFEQVGMDLVGPLPKSAQGHKYILVIMDYTTRYPVAVPLRKATSRNIARELLLLFSRVRIMVDLCRLLQVKHLRMSVYHPQTDGLVERVNQTLKRMLKRVVDKEGRNWDLLLPYVFFAFRETPQASTGFTPFELLFGRRPLGLLDVAREALEEQPSPFHSLVDYIQDMQCTEHCCTSIIST